jgi:hypothetical protein
MTSEPCCMVRCIPHRSMSARLFPEDSYQGFAIEGGSKGVKKLEDCSGQQPHRLESYDPSSLTTAVSVPECRVRRYPTFIAVFHRHWLVLRDPFCNKGVPSRQFGSSLRRALAGISEQSRKESTAGALKCATVISPAVCADRQGQRTTHFSVQSPTVVGAFCKVQVEKAAIQKVH